MEALIVADTDVIIDYFSGIDPSSAIIADLIDQDRLAITSITVFELYAGVTGAGRLNQIDQLVSLVPILPLELSEAVIASQIYSDLKKSGKIIGNQDIFIAAICLARQLSLFTRNMDHFSRIPHLLFFEKS